MDFVPSRNKIIGAVDHPQFSVNRNAFEPRTVLQFATLVLQKCATVLHFLDIVNNLEQLVIQTQSLQLELRQYAAQLTFDRLVK